MVSRSRRLVGVESSALIGAGCLGSLANATQVRCSAARILIQTASAIRYPEPFRFTCRTQFALLSASSRRNGRSLRRRTNPRRLIDFQFPSTEGVFCKDRGPDRKGNRGANRLIIGPWITTALSALRTEESPTNTPIKCAKIRPWRSFRAPPRPLGEGWPTSVFISLGPFVKPAGKRHSRGTVLPYCNLARCRRRSGGRASI